MTSKSDLLSRRYVEHLVKSSSDLLMYAVSSCKHVSGIDETTAAVKFTLVHQLSHPRVLIHVFDRVSADDFRYFLGLTAF